MTRPERQEIILSYDNMCHLNNLKVAKNPLPLPGKLLMMCVTNISSPLGNLAFLWSDIIKIIDTLHIKNHKDSRCKELYDPEKIKADNPSLNTMSCEQTFVWLSRYKKILSAMRKTHFHFYLHRMVKRRNIYIEYCYANNRRPLLPKARAIGN